MSPSGHKRVFDEEVLVDLTQFPDRIADTFAGKTVLVTGATGFVGRALVERILHNTDVKKVYILIKSKRGKGTQERFAHYFDSCFFDPLKKERPESLKRVEAIQGDLSELEIGISREDRRKLIDEVNIIYHSGASVRFDEYIKKMIMLNVRGTRNMIALAKEVKNLQLFVHVSTTYCQPRNVVLNEDVSITPHNPHDMIRIAENMDEGTLNILTSKLVGDYGNTYTFSKALAEAIVFEQMDKLPILVVRPSIVMPCIKHPIPGFTDSEYGPMSLWILYCKGMLRVTRVKPEYVLDYVTLDMVINTLLITTYNYINNTEKKVSVCNATNIQWTMKYWHEVSVPLFEEQPFSIGLGFPWVFHVQCPFLFFIMHILFQLVPAVLVDNALQACGVKSKRKLLDIQRKITRSNEVLRFYSECPHWNFKNDTIRTLRMDLNEREDETYPLNIEEIDLMEYYRHGLAMLRELVVHEKKEDMEKSKIMYQRMKVIHNIMRACFYGWLLWHAYATLLPLCIRFVFYIFDV